MKKILLFLTVMFFGITSAQAAENKLYFTDDNDRLYYDSDLYDENLFMYHTDMLPGSSYTDELIIENGSETEYSLYLKVDEEERTQLSEELLKSIEMTIELDGEVIYDGYADGLDYNDDGVNLQDAILIGLYKPYTESKLVVKTKLSPDYSNTDNKELSNIKWNFYARYSGNTEVLPINPDTGNNISKIVMILFAISLIVLGSYFIVRNFKKA